MSAAGESGMPVGLSGMGHDGSTRQRRGGRVQRALRQWRRWSGRHPVAALALRLGLSFILVVSLTLGLLAIPLACTTRITPPAVSGESATVLLIDHGRTPSLVLPRPDGGYDRWVYGDWGWYAIGNTSWLRGPIVLFWPTQGALGREQFDTAHLESIVAQVVAEKRYRITVAAEDAHALQRDLTALFDSRRDTLVQQVDGPLWFVHHPESYTYFSNSNHKTSEWLRALGCETRGPAFYSRWSVRAATDE